MNYFKKGCDGDSSGACNNAGMIYQSGHEKSNIPRDMAKAIKYFEKGCNDGHRAACFNLSSIYLTGKNGVEKNMEKALDLSIKCCELGHPYACANLSRMYSIGDGVEKDEAKSLEFKKLAQELHSKS